MKLRDKWEKSWDFGRKLQLFMVIIIITLTLTAILVSTSSSVTFLTKQNEQVMADQLAAMASEYNGTLDQYQAVVLSLVMDKNIQKYCGLIETGGEMNAVSKGVYDVLENALNMQNNANFIAILNNNTATSVYNGNYSLSNSKFESAWEQDYRSGIRARRKGSLMMSFANHYYDAGQYTLSFYFPIYSVTKIDTELGMMVINFNDGLVEHLNGRTHYIFSCLYLTDTKGCILSNTNQDKIGQTVSFGGKLTGDSGSFWHQSRLIHYQRIGDWNIFLVNEVSARHLYRSNIQIILLLLAVMLVFLVVSLLAANRMIMLLYRPLNKVIAKMNHVSAGNLRTRISTEQMDGDSLKLAAGFNRMMDEIDRLMKQVAKEERQVAQLRFESLQSQIQPHFLYNTLDCIHWQALADNDTDTSRLIKALASYYRICLSEGQDVIPLATELEHIRNYLIIQNLRYDDIIELDIRVEEPWKEILLPKITLQPLIENSIYHGMRVQEGRRGRIIISTVTEEQRLYLVVDDDGQGMSQEQISYINDHLKDFDQTIGYGINNVNKRIELLYGKEYGIKYGTNELGGVRVKIRLLTDSGGQEE